MKSLSRWATAATCNRVSNGTLKANCIYMKGCTRLGPHCGMLTGALEEQGHEELAEQLLKLFLIVRDIEDAKVDPLDKIELTLLRRWRSHGQMGAVGDGMR